MTTFPVLYVKHHINKYVYNYSVLYIIYVDFKFAEQAKDNNNIWWNEYMIYF